MIGLKENFASVSLDQWLERLKKDLKSEDLHELNFKDQLEGIDYNAYSHHQLVKSQDLAPAEFPYTRGLSTNSNAWKNAFLITIKSAEEANEKALHVLMHGVDALIFEFDENPVDLNVLLKDIGLEHIHTTFFPKTIQQVNAILEGPGQKAKEAISIAIDLHENPLSAQLNELTDSVRTNQFPLLLADGFKIQQCGANIEQELSFILSSANEYLIVLINSGLTIDEAAACIHFRIGIGSNYFQEIAKIRALKLLWGNIVKQYDPKHACSFNCRITAQTGSLNKSAKDPYTNLLRQTTEVMSALAGGIDQIIVTPFDKDSRNGISSLSERMAINIPLILKEESYLHAVIDPAGGSYSVEDLTNTFSDKAWKHFQEMDDQGGIFNEACKTACLENVKTTAKKRVDQLKNKEKTLIGVNKFPSPSPEENSFGNYGSYLGLNMINFERDI
jgi:methylmalonyl-CoA mutase